MKTQMKNEKKKFTDQIKTLELEIKNLDNSSKKKLKEKIKQLETENEKITNINIKNKKKIDNYKKKEEMLENRDEVEKIQSGW